MSKKKLIVFGCSWTDPEIVSEDHSRDRGEYDGPKWFELLAEKWNMECITFGRGGQGNEYICSSVQDFVLDRTIDKSDIGMMLIAFTQAKRIDFSYQAGASGQNDTIKNPERPVKRGRISENIHWQSKLQYDSFRGDHWFYLRRSLRQIYNLQLLLKKQRFPWHMMSSLPLEQIELDGLFDRLFQNHSSQSQEFLRVNRIEGNTAYQRQKSFDDKVALTISTDPSGYSIDSSKYLGWPPVKCMGGIALCDILNPYTDFITPKPKEPETSQTLSDQLKARGDGSNIDGHPNNRGHQVIADYLFSTLNITDQSTA